MALRREAMLTRLLDNAVRANPAKPAIVHGAERISYGALRRRVDHCAAGLRDLGIHEGDCVAVVLSNCPEFVVAFFACARLHAILLPLNPQYTREELQKLMSDGAPRAIIAGSPYLSMCRGIATGQRRGIPVLAADEAVPGTMPSATLTGDCEAATDAKPFAGRALYLYTSGSTDTFKRICCTQENLFFEAHNFVESTGINAQDTILCTIPLYHSYGLGNCLLDAVYAGATLVIEPDSTAPFAARHRRMLELLRAEDVRVYPGVPFQFEVLAASNEDVGAAFRDVKWCISSGDVLPKRIFDRFRVRTGHPIRSLYGSTEAGSISMDVGAASDVRHGSLGLPLRNVTVKVRGESGQIWVKSPVIPPGGYDNRPEINATVFRDGFYDTGDVGRLDERGCLVMTGRKQSFFDVGGHKVDLAEVEEVLLGMGKVREAAAVGIAIPNLGGVVKAVVAAHESCREAEILDHCRRHLAAFKVPRFVEFREMLPRSPLGKVLRKELSAPDAWLNDVPSARELPGVPHARRIDWLAQRIQEQVATILRCEPAAIARGVPFQSLGFDSLRAVELQERLSRMSGVALSVTTLWNHTSIDAYAAFLLDAMQGPAPPQQATATDALDELTRDEIAAMLAQELNLKQDA